MLYQSVICKVESRRFLRQYGGRCSDRKGDVVGFKDANMTDSTNASSLARGNSP